MVLRALSIAQATDADVLVKKGSGIYGGCVILCATTTDTLIKVYDSATVAGVAATNMIDVVGIDASLEGNTSTKASSITEPIKFTSGLVFVITGAGGLGTIWYK